MPAKRYQKPAATPHPMIATLMAERRRQGITQRSLAGLMGTTQSALSELEAGITKDPRLSTIKKMADALGVIVTWEMTFTRAGEGP